MTAARITQAELRDAARVANDLRVAIRLQRGETVAEVKPVDLPQTEADKLDMMDLRRK